MNDDYILNQQEKLSKPKINKVVLAAKTEFERNGIVNSKIRDIAKLAGVGEASVYRYFKDKTELVDLVAFYAWSQKSHEFETFITSHMLVATSGVEQLLVIFDLFADLYFNHKDMLKFMEDYGNYRAMTNPDTNTNILASYLESLKELIYSFVALGIQEGTVKEETIKEDIYEYFILSLLPTIQNLAIRSSVLNNNTNESNKRLIFNMRKVFIIWVKK